MKSIRRTGATSAATLFGMAATVAVAHLIAPDWTRTIGLDFWNVPALNAQVQSDLEHSRELSEEIEESRRRFSLKEQIVQNMLTGQITLKEASDQFLSINKNHAASMLIIRATYQRSTDEENSICNVVSVAIPRIQGGFSDKILMMSRLVSAYKDLTQSHSRHS